MGLDIALIRITKVEVHEHQWLVVSDNPELKSRYRHLIKRKTTSDAEFDVWYYEEIGYQRKGVVSQFYNTYEADEFIFTKSEVDELSKYIEEKHRPTFKEQIQSRFVEGDTLLMICY